MLKGKVVMKIQNQADIHMPAVLFQFSLNAKLSTESVNINSAALCERRCKVTNFFVKVRFLLQNIPRAGRLTELEP